MAIEDEVKVTANCVSANEWSPKQKLAKGLRGVDDCISNSDEYKSNNRDGGDDSTDEASSSDEGRVAARPVVQLGPGLFPPHPASNMHEAAVGALETDSEDNSEDEDAHASAVPGFLPLGARAGQQVPALQEKAAAGESDCTEEQDGPQEETRFLAEETVLIFDWDDTVLPSSWVQSQGLRLDESSVLNAHQREQLNEVARVSAETLRIAKQLGTVVLITNAERGWIELSCQKFMPTLYPSLEGIKVLSARTTYESPDLASPLDWKVYAFQNEILRLYGADTLKSDTRRKNVLSLGDSVHEREALLRATEPLPNCRSKSLKFVERPDIAQICKQHSLVTSCFERIAHHDGNLDLCIRCT
ncbi:unnamed protein product [Polarella glacialis]|uniref:Uncharacterized protein n=1 Tax=Polarella glacialis TaxID=89957 RepID=A0A813GG06_POLGL|nr:unnamed protein product [Polarella glacialis]CAE8625290.1 unnamed protein product [Polarella glacialis]CAE8642499.1 unnamed protein product [Polarella glacialis]|mmetsp:Transcript_40190/g.64987  ORF Transcript_40190/g.64987 Transcript_40190/m.64987 type:complete len:359 (-) Transcript_40190:145-1221(-)